MKIQVQSTKLNVPVINITVYTDHPVLDEDPQVAASIDLTKYSLPDRPVIAKDRARIKGWMIDDFESFVESVEALCEEDYGLICTYKNVSDDHSHYYNYLVCDEDGKPVVKVRFRLRIANHKAHRTKEQQRNKKRELESTKLHELMSEQDISRLTSYFKVIVVNNERYASYEEAFEDVNAKIERAVEVMSR